MLEFAMAGKYYRGNTPPKMPKNPEEGAAAISTAVLKLFSRSDGEAADWPLIAESLLKVAFDCLDRVQDDDRRASLLRRVETGTYDRMAKNVPDPWQDTPAGLSSGSPRPDPDGPDLSAGPRPPSRK